MPPLLARPRAGRFGAGCRDRDRRNLGGPAGFPEQTCGLLPARRRGLTCRPSVSALLPMARRTRTVPEHELSLPDRRRRLGGRRHVRARRIVRPDQAGAVGRHRGRLLRRLLLPLAAPLRSIPVGIVYAVWSG